MLSQFTLVKTNIILYNIFMETLIVNKKYNERKLSKYILDSIPYLNYGTFCKILRNKDIKINGKRINTNCLIYCHDKIEIYIPKKLETESSNYLKPYDLDIFYEDKYILILNKPQNIEVTGENSLTSIIHQKYSNISNNFKPMPCHRLDRNTCGLIIFAKTPEALDILLKKFKNHEIEKHYLATVFGHPKEDFKRVEAYLFKDTKKSIVYISETFKKGYKKIVTSYSVLERKPDNTSILDVEIETGKTHQIRAHLAHLGYPIIGDR